MYIKSRRENLLNVILSASGIFSIILSLFTAYLIYFGEAINIFIYSTPFKYLLILCAELVFVNFFTGLNKSFFYRGIYREAIVSFEISLMLVFGLIFVLFWLHGLTDSRRLVVSYFAIGFVILDFLSRVFIRYFLLSIFKKGKFSSKVLVVADSDDYKLAVRNFDKELDWTRYIIGISTPDVSLIGRRTHGKKVICTNDDLLEFLTRNSVDELVVLSKNYDSDENLKNTLATAEEMGIKVDVKVNLTLFDYMPSTFVKFDKIGNIQCISVSRNYMNHKKLFAKHLMDFTGGMLGFLIFCLFYVIIGPLIKMDSKGPILFSQPRVGKNGRIFKCYKFRSMCADAEARKKELMAKNEVKGLMFKMEDDPRITRIGHFIRKTSIDELPQFINVLKGDMSLVGTRPPTLDEYVKYEPKHKARVSMLPGLTGLWQVSGRSDIKNFDDVVKLDMKYIDNWSILLDIKIVLLTIKVVLFGKGAK
ncbi:exopolysaccharide biosynthesis polyprenyl glycosylphosphotransferase [Succinivibrio dextrinosolvens]|uniref:sugar transferase n=1 Tax=Succinivibrio dextrinosolvens TaxID=83771 RepID=UPI0008E4EF04|nr:sugar transferase [Succinivibrio dextrinosolvens]SFS85806.1 exopolysaccharide biosynthesis polyprenyl glycosylphosphotransferase [Succinivibrio dextrinosolvens]